MQHARHLLALCVLMTSSALAGPVSTAFTYQGQLTFNGSPASGNFDFKFDLYDAASGGVALDSISQPALPVSSGLINTTLDYSSVLFNGQALWILVSVRPAGSGTYTALSPRQSINVTPYALFALGGNGGGGLTLPYSSGTNTSGTAFAVSNSGSGRGVFGSGSTGNAVEGNSGSGSGVKGVTAGTSGWVGPAAGVWGDSYSSYGAWGSSFTADGVHGNSTSAAGVFGGSVSGAGVWADSQAWDGVHGVTHNPSNNTSGVAGFGDGGNTGTFGASTSGAGVSGGSSTGTGVYGNSINGAGVWGDSGTFDGVHGHTQNALGNTSGVAGFGDNSNYGVYGNSASGDGVAGYSSNGFGVVGESAAGVAGAFVSDSAQLRDVIEARALSGVVFKVTNAGDVIVHGTFFSNSVDYADRLPAETGIEAADVVVIGADGVLRRSSRANETDVAGVYSTRPGMVGHQEEETRPTIPVALAGVIPVKAVVENGAIHPGDLLVSSSSPGRAMRAPSDPRPGTVIGKAMQPLENGEGQITMLVMLR